MPGAVKYRVYESQSRFLPYSSWNLLAEILPGAVSDLTYDAVGHLVDGLVHYYVVRSIGIGNQESNALAMMA